LATDQATADKEETTKPKEKETYLNHSVWSTANRECSINDNTPKARPSVGIFVIGTLQSFHLLESKDGVVNLESFTVFLAVFSE
jgi:hypothetical protein